ncbi:unnamed protein product [Urochloa humidicola]
MASSLAMRRHRRGIADEGEDCDDRSSGTTLPDDTDTGTDEEEEEEEEEDHRPNLGLHSMTAKGIQHLCSELLEIKKASEQDLRANVYLSYLSFIRMFQEAGDLDKDVHRLKRQVVAHRRLIQNLMSSKCGGGLLCSSSTHYYSNKDEEEEEADMDVDEEEVELEVLLSEHRMEQALELVVQQQQQANNNKLGRALVVERLVSVGGNPRTPRAELLRALSGLCKLGEPERANRLLFSWHHHRALQLVSSSSLDESVKDLARMVFSSIAGASRSLVALHGVDHPYTPQLLRWAREEMLEDLFMSACLCVRRMSSLSSQSQESLLLCLLEAAGCAASYATSLQLPLDVGGLMAPRILEALPTYARQLKEVVRLLVASDADQALGRFRRPVPAPLVPAHPDDEEEHEHYYCLLTASGRKLVTLLQEVVADVACPLQRLGMEPAAVQLVADLFGEYLSSVLLANPNPNKQQQQHSWQVSVLINCTTLASLLPTIWSSGPAQEQVGSLIKGTAVQVWTGFCKQFIRDTMLAAYSRAEEEGAPSACLQVVFLRVRRLKEAYGAILGGGDGTMRALLRELMEAVISWLSTNPPESWAHAASSQAQLDVHFLLEIARLGGVDVTASALGLLAETTDDINRNEGAAHAASHAAQLLLRHNINSGSASETQAAEESAESSNGDMASTKSSDEFISIEEDEDEQDLATHQAAPQHSENTSIHDDDSRRPPAAAPTGQGRGRKKKPAALTTSSRPRWH